MSKQFQIDLAHARAAEELVKNIISSSAPGYKVEFVGD